MEGEVWKDVVGYEGLYQVSDKGRIKSLRREIIYKNGRIHTYEERILKVFKDEDGYNRINLTKTKTHKQYAIHRLVAEAFLPNPDNLPQVNHKDENPSNNNVENLEWCDSTYNINYGTRKDKIRKKVYQYSTNDVLIAIFPSVEDCVKNGYNHTCVVECCRKKKSRKTHKGFRWSYTPIEAPNA